ncbi:Protein of unknown function [Cotesia congregata]|uniref:Uncharacterized protein n=1 Tax=Cotesia congregata TaxID=51543 RepID=A0A8J2HAH9_COTCN|nr:Protein of unknown function [Cotesia congregata]
MFIKDTTVNLDLTFCFRFVYSDNRARNHPFCISDDNTPVWLLRLETFTVTVSLGIFNLRDQGNVGFAANARRHVEFQWDTTTTPRRGAISRMPSFLFSLLSCSLLPP